jgi:hypothetical protein
MLTEVLLALTLDSIVVVGASGLVLLGRINRHLSVWHESWGRNPTHASDYHAKEILKYTQEIAHYLAVRHLAERAEFPERLPERVG